MDVDAKDFDGWITLHAPAKLSFCDFIESLCITASSCKPVWTFKCKGLQMVVLHCIELPTGLFCYCMESLCVTASYCKLMWTLVLRMVVLYCIELPSNPLVFLLLYGVIVCYSILLQAGVDISVKNGCTPLH